MTPASKGENPLAAFVSRPWGSGTRRSWRITSLVAVFILLQAFAAVLLFGTKPAGAWFGTGSCPMPGGFVSGQKCLAVDANGVEVPWKGEIILPKDTLSISDHALYNGTHPIAGNYELQLVEDNGTCCTVYQTIDYTVASDGSTTPATSALNSAILTEAFTHHLVGTGGLVGYFLYISNGTALPTGADCQNTVTFIGATGSLGSGISATGEKCNTPTPVPGTGALAGHIIDCTSGVATSEVGGGTIAVTSGPELKPAAPNPISYPLVPTGTNYVESASVPPGYHFVYACGGNSQGTDSHATAAVTVPLQGTGVANFYVVRDSGILVGHIIDCTGGTPAPADIVPAGSLTVESIGTKANPAQWSVPSSPGYKMTATSPAGFHIANCGAWTATASQTVPVPVNGEGSATFYVVRDMGTLSADIFDCTAGVMGTTDVPGGTITVAGLTPISSQANPLLPTSVVPGDDYHVTATAPTGYHFVECGQQPANGLRTLSVPANGSAHAIYYVTHDTGMLAGHIYDCSIGATTTEIPAGTMAATGGTPIPQAANPLSPTTVATGDYTVTATVPSGYVLVLCGGQGVNSQTITVHSGETATAIFYAAGRGHLDAHIYDCTAGVLGTTDVPGGTVTATGPTAIAAQPNPLPLTAVNAGPYDVTATAPNAYHFVLCDGKAATGARHLVVPVNGADHAVYYVTHDTGNLGGHIYDCTNGPTTTEVPAGTLGAAGATTIPVQANPLGNVVVQTGDYTITAGAPTGYTLVACNGKGAGNTQTITVPANGTAGVIFYVFKDPSTPTTPTGTTNPLQGVQGVQGVQGIQGAGTTQPNTGHADLIRGALVSLLLAVAGGVLLLVGRRRFTS